MLFTCCACSSYKPRVCGFSNVLYEIVQDAKRLCRALGSLFKCEMLCLFQAGPGGSSGAAAGTGAGADRTGVTRDTQRTADTADAARRRLAVGTGSGGINPSDAPKHKSPGADEAVTKDTVRLWA